MMNDKLRLNARILIGSMAVLLSLSWLPVYAAPSLQSPAAQSTQTGQMNAQGPIPAGCETVAPGALRDELNRVSQSIFAPENSLGATTTGSPVNIDALVARQWKLVGVDAAIDSAVDDAVTQVSSNSDLWQKWLSGWSPDQAAEMTNNIVATAFTSKTFRDSVDALAAGVAGDLAQAVGSLSAESATQAT